MPNPVMHFENIGKDAVIALVQFTMWPETIFPALIALAFWFVVAWPLRAYLAPLFANKVEVS